MVLMTMMMAMMTRAGSCSCAGRLGRPEKTRSPLRMWGLGKIWVAVAGNPPKTSPQYERESLCVPTPGGSPLGVP
eukprot:6510414-Pyramimonas_sp.AAC.1